tara:strand:+ start:153 stop:557 length:405 start_codon:yes stop_codon:yes gene_type:complete
MKKLIALLLLTPFLAVSAATPIFEYDCTFTHTADQKGYREDDSMKLLYMSFDDNSGMMRGNAGGAEVKTIYVRDQLTFVETTPSGNVTTTTILMGTGAAVHSRNMFWSGRLGPSQFYGGCDITDLRTGDTKRAQ